MAVVVVSGSSLARAKFVTAHMQVWAKHLTAYTNRYSALEDDDDDASELEGDSPHHGEVFPREVLHRLGCDELEMIVVHMHYTPPPAVCTD